MKQEMRTQEGTVGQSLQRDKGSKRNLQRSPRWKRKVGGEPGGRSQRTGSRGELPQEACGQVRTASMVGLNTREATASSSGKAEGQVPTSGRGYGGGEMAAKR